MWEGIEARFEGRPPKWSHQSVYDVTPEEVDKFFRPLENPDEEVNRKQIQIHTCFFVCWRILFFNSG